MSLTISHKKINQHLLTNSFFDFTSFADLFLWLNLPRSKFWLYLIIKTFPIIYFLLHSNVHSLDFPHKVFFFPQKHEKCFPQFENAFRFPLTSHRYKVSRKSVEFSYILLWKNFRSKPSLQLTLLLVNEIRRDEIIPQKERNLYIRMHDFH